MKKPRDKYKPIDGFYILATKNFVWGFFGLLFGIIINNVSVFIVRNLEIKNMVLLKISNITMQLFICSVFLASIQLFNEYFTWSWQNITPGLFFISFFFGSQFKTFTETQDLFVIPE